MIQIDPKSGQSLYSPISLLYKKLFGEKVYKIPVTLAETCPNREGLKGMKVCIFCDEWGSAARSEMFSVPLEKQIQVVADIQRTKRKSHKHLVYFQAYTNSFLRLQVLKDACELALKRPHVCGIVIGTRPDCISKGLLDFWKELSEKTHLTIEFGVQSFFDDQLKFLERGHSAQESIAAILRTSALPKVQIGIHLMFGLPNESDPQLIETAKLCAELPIASVKLHHLHVLKNTGLEELYHQGRFEPIDRPEYARRVALFLEHLPARIYIDRLAAFSSRGHELVAPDWTRRKMETNQFILDTMVTLGTYQGKKSE